MTLSALVSRSSADVQRISLLAACVSILREGILPLNLDALPLAVWKITCWIMKFLSSKGSDHLLTIQEDFSLTCDLKKKMQVGLVSRPLNKRFAQS